MANNNTMYLSNADAPTFALKFGDLVKLSKAVIESKFGSAKPELLADDFEFRFPVVELNKARFCEAFGSFKLDEAFPDMVNAYYGFRLDPYIPGRIWFDTQGKGTHTGNFGGPFSYISPTQKEVVLPPQALSFTFNEEGLLKKFTGGYVIDRHLGNTGGLGGVFGIMHAIGKTLPFPEAQPFSLSTRYRLFLSLDEAARRVYSLPMVQTASSFFTTTKESIMQAASGISGTTTDICSSTSSYKEKVIVSLSVAKEKIVVAFSFATEKALETISGVKEQALGVVSDTKAKVLESANGVYASTKEKVVERTSGVYTSASQLSSGVYSARLESAQRMYTSMLQQIKHFLPTVSSPGAAAASE